MKIYRKWIKSWFSSHYPNPGRSFIMISICFIQNFMKTHSNHYDSHWSHFTILPETDIFRIRKLPFSEFQLFKNLRFTQRLFRFLFSSPYSSSCSAKCLPQVTLCVGLISVKKTKNKFFVFEMLTVHAEADKKSDNKMILLNKPMKKTKRE